MFEIAISASIIMAYGRNLLCRSRLGGRVSHEQNMPKTYFDLATFLKVLSKPQNVRKAS
jgi:hypothetical protein